jgi:predicted nuclease of predicted toxin-antitoxin system
VSKHRTRKPGTLSASLPYRFLLDEDLDPKIAAAARGLGLDVVSVQEAGRRGLADDDHLRWAARERRVIVTRNRDDYIEWTALFFQRGEDHAGVLIVPAALSMQRPERVAHAMERWVRRVAERFGNVPLSPYFVDYLSE